VNDFLAALRAKAGCYQGGGINHEAQTFIGALVVKALFGGVLLWFRAQSETGEVFHEEIVLIGRSFTGGLSMTSLNTNVPAAQIFVGDALDAAQSSFISGDFSNAQEFRERVSLAFGPTGEITYAFAWGLPGQDVEDRSTATMTPINDLPSGCPI
jgi:hypothetical protein